MDFNAYTHQLGTIDTAALPAILEYGRTIASNPKAKRYFNPAVNPKLNSVSWPTTYGDAAPCVQQVVRLLAHVFEFRQYTSCEFNFLQPNGVVREHTDQSSASTPTGINYKFGTLVSQWHSVHVPLTGSARYLFRRDPRMELEEVSMVPGQLMWFNNYVQHLVVNDDAERVNMILHFYDPDWDAKRRIYEQHPQLARGMY